MLTLYLRFPKCLHGMYRDSFTLPCNDACHGHGLQEDDCDCVVQGVKGNVCDLQDTVAIFS